MSDNVDIQGLEFQIESNADNAVNGLDKLSAALERLRKVTGKGTGLTDVAKGLEGINKEGSDSGKEGIGTLAEALNKLGTASQLKGLSGVYSRLRKISELNFSNLTSVPQAVSNIASAAVPKANLPTTPAAIPAISTAPVTESVLPQDVISDLTAATSNVSGFSAALSKLKSVMNATKTGFGKFGAKLKEMRNNFKSMHPAVSGLSAKINQFMRSIGRIAMYRIIRTMLSSIVKAIKEGAQNLYQYSSAIGGDFAASLDSAATSVLFLKNSFATMVAPLVNALVPVLDMIIDKLTTAINLLAQFFAAMSGKSTYTQATKSATKYGDAVTAAGEAVKSFTMGFDELNVMDSSSSGGGGTGADVSKMFQEAEIDSGVLDAAKKVQDVLSWIEEHMTAIKNAALGVAAGVAAWKVASMFTKNMQTVWGLALSIGGAVMLVKEALDAWNNGVNWENLLGMLTGMGALVGGLALLFASISPALAPIGAAIGLIAGGIALVVTGFKDWLENGKSLEALAAITVGILAIGGAIAILTGGWIPLVIAAVAAIVVAVVMYWDDIKAWTINLRNNVKDIFSQWGTWINDNVIIPVCDFFRQLWTDVSGFFVSLWTGIQTIWATVSTWFDLSVITPVKTGFDTALTLIKNFFANAWTNIKGVWNAVGSWFDSTVITPVKTKFSSLVDGVKTFFSTLWEDVKGIWTGAGDWFQT